MGGDHGPAHPRSIPRGHSIWFLCAHHRDFPGWCDRCCYVVHLCWFRNGESIRPLRSVCRLLPGLLLHHYVRPHQANDGCHLPRHYRLGHHLLICRVGPGKSAGKHSRIDRKRMAIRLEKVPPCYCGCYLRFVSDVFPS